MTLVLERPELLKSLALIDGSWCGADDGTVFAVTNPADGAVITAVPRLQAAETGRAITAAEKALPGWRKRSCTGRYRRRWTRP